MFFRSRFPLCCLLLSLSLGCSSKETIKTGDAQHIDVDVTSLENQAAGLMGQFNYDKAVTACKELCQLPGISKAQRQKFEVDLAIALLNRRQEEDLQQAITLLDKVIRVDSQELRAKYCRALLHYHEGRTSSARGLFEDVAKADPTDSYALYYVGQCLFLTGEYELALEKFSEAQKIDPYLRSAYYGAFQSAQRLQEIELSRGYLEQFQRLAANPRARLAELKYTRMGPKAEVYISDTRGDPQPLPDGQLFAKPKSLSLPSTQALTWQNCKDSATLPNITLADVNGDALSDIYIANAFADSKLGSRNAILLSEGQEFKLEVGHPLAMADNVNTVLWGDYDNDGETDAYLCCRGANQLWRREPTGQWLNVTDETEVSGGNVNTVDGACFDADHDGDLDYLLVNNDGKNLLLSNNRNGTFKSIAQDLGISANSTNTKQVLIADVDSDDDADILYINAQLPHEVMINDRFWNYQASQVFKEFNKSTCFAATACDTNIDGQVEIFTIDTEGISQWQPDETGEWRRRRVVSQPYSEDGSSMCSIELVDIDGDSNHEILTVADGSWKVYSLDGKNVADSGNSSGVLTTAAIWHQSRGPAIVGFRPSEAPQVWQPGIGRYAFVMLTLSGKTDKAEEMRSNASGIGVQGSARIQDRWSALQPFRSGSGPGQSLQPITIGLAGRPQIDFLRLLWPDGVSQTELKLKPGGRIDIAETQRQAGSCPLVFVWDGQRFVFVADVLGAGGIGFNLGRGDYYEPRPQENLHLSTGLLQPKDGKYVVKLGEPMEEICYFDAVRLVAYDVPPDWNMTLDERFGAAEPFPTGEPLFYRNQLIPTRATDDRGQDITGTVISIDKVAAPLDRQDYRFVGLADQRSISLTFDRPIDSLLNPTLIFDGWVEYAYSQTAFAAWQAREQYLEPTIEARGEDGNWQVIAPRFGYMAGTPRQCSMPLDKDLLPAGTRELRVSTNMQIYWDRLAIVDAEIIPHLKSQELELVTALVDDVGFSTRRLLNQRYTEYDYDRRPPLADARHPAGYYTRLGDARELVAATDNALAIIGPGEELHLEFIAPTVGPPTGWTRHFVLESDGWCKDADLFTKDAGTVEPLPVRADAMDEQATRHRRKLHAKYNTRFKSGY